VGGTGQTNTNKFLNSGIAISQGTSGVFTLTKGDGTTDTTTITKAKLGLSYTDGADVTGDNTANDVTNVNGTAASTVQGGAARATAGLTSTGDVNRAVPTGKGGTGQTNTNKFLNSDLGITLDGTNITLTKAGDTNSTDTVPGALKNSTIAIDATTGVITGITGDGIAIRNDKTTATQVGLGNVDNTSDADVVLAARAATTATDVGLGNVDNANTATILAGNLTGTVNGTAVATIKSGAAAGATANQDTTTSILAGNLTGTVNGTAVATIKSGAAAGATANQDSTSAIRAGTTAANVGLGNVTNESKSTMFAAPTFTGTVSGVSKAHVGLSQVDNTSDATILAGNLTGTVNGTAVATIKSGAAAGATANQDSTASILAGDLTGSVNGTAVATIKSGAALGASSNQDSTTSIRAGTTATDVGLGSVPNVDMRNASNITSGTIPIARTPTTVRNTNISFSRPSTGTLRLNNGSNNDITLTAADAQITSDANGINVASVRKATHNGTAINSSGNVTSSMSVASGGSIVVGNITIDGTNGRILITD
jgi:hypothetical protein